MRQRISIKWNRLDNVSKVFPALANNKDTKVFRYACQLNELVDQDILQSAVDITIESFPLYKSVLRKGFFWYYFESSDLHLEVKKESLPVCARIFYKNSRNLLCRVSFFNYRINFEVFHALSDGTGALWFMKTLIYNYLILKHSDDFEDYVPELDIHASISERMDDSFGKHYKGETIFDKKSIKGLTPSTKKAFRIPGHYNDENRIRVIEGSMSAKRTIEISHEYNTSLTIFLTSLYIHSIYKTMDNRAKKYPIVVSVPINLRQYFESNSARNFFSTMDISYNFEKDSENLESIIKKVSECFNNELSEETLTFRLNKFMLVEKNPIARIIPLDLKDLAMKVVNHFTDRGLTTSISNTGRITMPKEFNKYIDEFSLCVSVRRPQITMCSFNDRLVISFSSPYAESDIQRNLFQFLGKKGRSRVR